MLQIIGHRGAKGIAPENTLGAIEQALEYNVDEIEVDVRVTNDNVPVLIHDKSLWRLTGRKVIIAEHSLQTLRTYKPDLATLSDAIHTINRRVPLLIDVKPREPIQPIVQVLNDFLDRGWQSTDFLLGSFSQRTLLDLDQALPNVTKVIIERFSTIRALRRARQLDTTRLSMNRYFLRQRRLRLLNKRGYSIYTYTTNNPSRAKRLADHGLIGVITDFPDRHQKSNSK